MIEMITALRWRNFWRLGALFCTMGFSFATDLTVAPSADWKQTTWGGEKAWTSTSAGWTAIVSEERARLVCLAPASSGSEGNLLYASAKASISWGGHRCWLGPQSEWKTAWPPPADWEASAAASLSASGTRLTVVHPHTEADYPPLSRSYEWRGGVLHCGVNWQGGHHHAVHILQVPQSSVIHVRRLVRKDLPLGYALLPVFNRPKALTTTELARDISRVEGDEITLRHKNVTEKIGFAPQEITADIGDWQLKMRPGVATDVTMLLPDLGLLTQVYLGDRENPFIEIEQLSPFGDNRPATCEILIEPTCRNCGAPHPQ